MKIKLETGPQKNDFTTIDEYIDTIKERLGITLKKIRFKIILEGELLLKYV